MSTSGKRPSIREILAQHNVQNTSPKPGMTDKDVADVLAPFSGLDDLFYATMKAGEALGKSLNIKTGKSAARAFSHDYARVVLSLILALRSLEKEIVALLDTPRGAYIEAKLPVDIFSLGGTLSFEVVDEGPAKTSLVGVTEIKGQMFDWGKSKRTLNEVFDKTEYYLRILG